MPSKKTAAAPPAKEKSTAMVPWSEKFAKYAQQGKEQLKSIAAGGVGIKFGRGSITVGGASVPNGRLECIIVGHCAFNAYYLKKYDPNEATPPDCYAFAVVNDDPEMAPHPQAADKQAELCSECDHNVYGSAETGRGKACGNNIRIGCLTAKDAEDAAGISTAELATGKISPTNLKSFKAYVEALEAEHGRPTWAVVTEISAHDDSKTQIRLEFRMVETIEDDEILTALEKRFLKIQDVLQVPFAAPIEKAAPARKLAAGGSQRFAAKKPAGRR